jgi:copper chaperone
MTINGVKAMNEVTIKVEGMSCGGCVRNVTGVLQALPGVVEASVSLDSASARVSYDPAKVSPEQMRAAVETAGFDSPL